MKNKTIYLLSLVISVSLLAKNAGNVTISKKSTSPIESSQSYNLTGYPGNLRGLPTSPTLIRIFDNAIFNSPTYECTVSVSSMDPEGDDIQYEIQWDIDPNFSNPSFLTTGIHSSGDTVTTAILLGLTAAEAETLFYWRARSTDSIELGIWSLWSEDRSFTMNLGVNDVYWYQSKGPQFKKCTKNHVRVEGDSVVLSKVDTLLTEGFEGSFPPTGWQVLVTGTPSRAWEHVGDQVHSGDSAIMVRYHPVKRIDSWCVTEAIDLSSYEACTLSFWGLDKRASYYGYHGIWLSTTSQSDTSTFSELQQIPVTSEGIWEHFVVDISAYAGQPTVYFAWRYNESNGTNWYIDDISIFENKSGGEGILTSPPVAYRDLITENPYRTSWDGAKWSKSSANDSIGMQFEYMDVGVWNLVPDSLLSGNSIGFFNETSSFCTVDISMLDPYVYDTLRMKLIFRSSSIKASVSPALKMLAIGNTDSIVSGISSNEKSVPFTLTGNHPNPFTNQTEIQYQLQKRVNIDLEVYDLTGRLIISLIKEVQKPGYYSIQWNGTDKNGNSLPSGVYFINMEAGDYKATKKMLLLR